MNVLLKPFVLAWCAVRHPFLRRQYHSLVFEKIDDVALIVLPEVFNPVLLRTGEFLARALEAFPLPPDANRVLDMGTGSGVGAIFAARRGARVVAVDINPEAVRCARLNALLNKLEDQIEVRQGDLMEPLTLHAQEPNETDEAGEPEKAFEQFDLVVFNPPYYQGRPDNNLDFAWRGQGVFERFAEGLTRVLSPQGQALVIFSSDGEWEVAKAALEAHNFHISVYKQVEYVNETVTAYQITPRSRHLAEPPAAS